MILCGCGVEKQSNCDEVIYRRGGRTSMCSRGTMAVRSMFSMRSVVIMMRAVRTFNSAGRGICRGTATRSARHLWIPIAGRSSARFLR